MPAWVNNQQNAGPWQVYFHQRGFTLQAEWVFTLLLLCFSGLVILFQFLWRIRKFIRGSEEFCLKMQQRLLEKPWNSEKTESPKESTAIPFWCKHLVFEFKFWFFALSILETFLSYFHILSEYHELLFTFHHIDTSIHF